MSSSSQAKPKSPTTMTSKPTSSRLPPPSLFQGPPSRNASNISLATPNPLPAPSTRPPGPKPSASFKNPLGAPPRTPPLNRSISARARQSQNDTDRSADALWAEMQNTLAEVELSADSGSHVFGTDHAKALEDLRSAQLGLARAWARNEADEGNEEDDDGEEEEEKVGIGKATGGLLGGDGAKDKEKSPEFGEGHGYGHGQDRGAGKNKNKNQNNKNLEEETENDILSARKRREANDRYFQRVNAGVLEVVGKLEDVAHAMRAVEKESRDIWSESEDLEGTETEISRG